MFSISPAEFLTIAVIALIVFGPRRLGEMARQAGRLSGELRRTAEELRSGLQTELDEVTKPVTDLRTELAAAGKGLLESAEGELRWVDVDEETGEGDAAPLKEVSAGGPGDPAHDADPPGADQGGDAEPPADEDPGTAEGGGAAP